MNRHIKLAILHAIVFSLILAKYISSDQEFKWLESGLHDINIAGDKIETSLVVNTPQKVFFVMLIAFPLITAMFHLFRAMDTVDGNLWRFIEYSITSSIMLYLLARSCNVISFDTTIMLVSVNAIVMLLGVMIQRLIDAGDYVNAKLLTGIAWLLFVVAWIPLARSFFSAISNLDSSNIPEEMPSKTTFRILFYSMVALFSSFGLVQSLEVLQVISPASADLGYDILSLTTKTSLVGIVAGGFFNR